MAIKVLKDITDKIEEFDPNFPCVKCIIKMLCSKSCSFAEDEFLSWPADRYRKFLDWLDYRRKV